MRKKFFFGGGSDVVFLFQVQANSEHETKNDLIWVEQYDFEKLIDEI